jgi:amylosucrase
MPGMAILGEAIVAPKEVMKHFGSGLFTARECDLAYNATHMALQMGCTWLREIPA